MLAGSVVLLVLGASILLHEWFHYLTAVSLGYNVSEFSVGFGPSVVSWARNKTRFCVRLLPLGGYVRIPELESTDNIRHGHKIAVAASGPAAHFVMAFVLFLVAAWVVAPSSFSDGAVVSGVAPDSETFAYGVHEGSVVTHVNGEPIDTWEDPVVAAAVATPESDTIRFVNRGSPGMSMSAPVDDWDDLVVFNQDNFTSFPSQVVFAGKSVVVATVKTPSILYRAVAGLPSQVADTFDNDNIESIDRPRTVIGLPTMSSTVRDAYGWFGVVALLGQLNIVFAVFNLLPVPPLDGGHMLTSSMDAALSKQTSEKLRRAAGAVGVMMMAGLAVMFISVVLSDILQLAL